MDLHRRRSDVARVLELFKHLLSGDLVTSDVELSKVMKDRDLWENIVRSIVRNLVIIN